MPQPTLELKRWKRVEYERLVETGVFTPGDRVELIDGLLVVAEPQSSPHYTAIRLVERVLARAFGAGWEVRTQAPIALDETSEPEPDVAVVRGDVRDYAAAHPADPVLVVEVRSRASSSIENTRRASTHAPDVRSTGSSTWSTACSRFIVSLGRRRRRPMGGRTTRWRCWDRPTSPPCSPCHRRGS